MDNHFWIERWSKHEIGFHQRNINVYLQRHWPSLGLAQGIPVFVPLCGKSRDMHWLREQGHPVIGIEVARDAVVEFFEEWGVAPQIARDCRFERFGAENIELLCGDYFALTRTDLTTVGAVFDRAALIALPPDMRQRYATRMREILPTGIPVLLITADYAQSEMTGPPFAVSDTEVRSLFSGLPIELLEEIDVSALPDNSRFRERGLTRLVERVYRIGHQGQLLATGVGR
jgi:thiopurine S-methyltransferase